VSTLNRPSARTHLKGPVLQFRLRVIHKSEIALGPGKVELLTAIQTHGSISKGAKSVGMSYMRAWTLVKIMNGAFRGPLVIVERGGTQGGSARLTPLGHHVLELYFELIKQSQSASKTVWSKLRKVLKK
jgi:molybdate transport system regulatory protein